MEIKNPKEGIRSFGLKSNTFLSDQDKVCVVWKKQSRFCDFCPECQVGEAPLDALWGGNICLKKGRQCILLSPFPLPRPQWWEAGLRQECSHGWLAKDGISAGCSPASPVPRAKISPPKVGSKLWVWPWGGLDSGMCRRWLLQVCKSQLCKHAGLLRACLRSALVRLVNATETGK